MRLLCRKSADKTKTYLDAIVVAFVIGSIVFAAIVLCSGCKTCDQWHFTKPELDQIDQDIRTNSVLGPITFPIN